MQTHARSHVKRNRNRATGGDLCSTLIRADGSPGIGHAFHAPVLGTGAKEKERLRKLKKLAEKIHEVQVILWSDVYSG